MHSIYVKVCIFRSVLTVSRKNPVGETRDVASEGNCPGIHILARTNGRSFLQFYQIRVRDDAIYISDI